MYIGQTGRSLQERINDLIRNSSQERMPFNDPHTAAPNLWAWSKTDSFQYEFSFTEFDKDDRLRITQESILLWLYRKEKGESTYCNFGRFNPFYTKSKNRSTGYIGRKLSKKREHSFNPSHKPLNDIGNPNNQKWMGLNWTPLIELNDFKKREIPNSLGVYKIFNSGQNLIYIGQSKKISNRLSYQLRRFNPLEPNLLFSYCIFGYEILDFQLKEIENDLIGSFSFKNSNPPKYQFKNLKI
jgi:hypothetical protein